MLQQSVLSSATRAGARARNTQATAVRIWALTVSRSTLAHHMWLQNISRSVEAARSNRGPSLVTVVTGSERDCEFWRASMQSTSRDVFRQDGDVCIVPVSEGTRKGNFLGTLNGWNMTKRWLGPDARPVPSVALMSMVFGEGRRFSPLTQAMGNRKPAFTTPLRSEFADVQLTSADLANLHTNLWVEHLRGCGFRGLLVKWGDEAIVPGASWQTLAGSFGDVDAIRFVWRRGLSDDLAREKEWVSVDPETNLMTYQFARQSLSTLELRMSERSCRAQDVAVNLGSVALSYEFLKAAIEELDQDIRDPSKWADWDPYVWIALFCRTEMEWRSEAQREADCGMTGIRKLESRYPDFYSGVSRVRQALEKVKGRPMAVGILDFGEAFWVDLGLHISLRRSLELLTETSEAGQSMRAALGVPNERDSRGNTIVRSTIAPGVDLRDSVVVDSVIDDGESVVARGVIVGGRHRRLSMPNGGAALFCAANRLRFTGPHAVAYRAVAGEITLPEGGRLTTLYLDGRPEQMTTNESLVDYSGDNYTKPVLGNRVSFEEASREVARLPSGHQEACWRDAWSTWLGQSR